MQAASWSDVAEEAANTGATHLPESSGRCINQPSAANRATASKGNG